jgi:hypothetical protein
MISRRQPWVSTQKGHNFWSDRWVALKVLQGFPEAVFRGVYTECLLGDEDVWSTEQEYRVKRAITFGPTFGSRSNFYSGFQRLFLLGKLRNRYWVTRMSGRQPWVSPQNEQNILSDRWIALKFLQGFLEVVFLGVTMEWLMGDGYVLSASNEYRLTRAITFDPIVGSRSNFYRGFQRLFSLGKLWNDWVTRMSGRQPWVSAQKGHNFWSDRWVALKFLQWFLEAVFIGVAREWLLGDEDVWSVELEYRLKRTITFGPTVGSSQILTGVSSGCIPWVSSGIAVEWRVFLVANLE